MSPGMSMESTRLTSEHVMAGELSLLKLIREGNELTVVMRRTRGLLTPCQQTAVRRFADGLHFDNVDAVAGSILARKSAASDALLATGRAALEAAGGAGFSRRDEIERLFRDLHGCVYHPLPKAKQTVFTGRVALGLTPIA